jgi:hypothetical protein
MRDSVSAGFVFAELEIPDNHCLQESLGPIIVVFKNPCARTNILPRALFVNQAFYSLNVLQVSSSG